MMKTKMFCWLGMLALCASPALGQFNSGSDGLSGAFVATIDREIDLSLAIEGDALTTPGNVNGVYDAARWVIVFKYSTITVDPGATVTFKNHPKGAPVVWLASGNVIIAGSVRLDGANGSQAADSSYAVPGPGGFSGGLRRLGTSHGFGPGGGSRFSSSWGDGGGYGTNGNSLGGTSLGGSTYGTVSILPLIGGSGGSYSPSGLASGGAGGGAILIASSMSISLPDPLGGIFALGGSPSGGSAGGGSGGGIRLLANDISGPGLLRATGGTGGFLGGKGRIRVEANTFSNDLDLGDPNYPVIIAPGLVFPDTATEPTLRVSAVNGVIVPVDPVATVRSGDVCFTSTGPVTIEIEAQNVPVGTSVQIRIILAFGGSQILTSSPLVGTLASSTATADFTFADGATEVQLSVLVP